MTNMEFVEALYNALLQRAPDRQGLENWVHALGSGLSHDQVFESFLQSLEYRQRLQMSRSGGALLPFPFGEELASLVFPIRVCDVGAMLLPGEPHAYSRLAAAGGCRVVGFEPVAEECARRSREEPGVVLLQHVVGDGTDKCFHVVNKVQYSSLYEPDFDFMQTFAALGVDAAVCSEEPVRTVCLDDVPEVRGTHFLKLDVQGAEFDVLAGARDVLRDVLLAHIEVEFAPMYKEQPLFPEIDRSLRERGFEFITFIHEQRYYYLAGSNPSFMVPCPPSRLLWADAVYLKRQSELENAGREALLRAAYILHVNYGMYDVAAHLFACHDAIHGGDLHSRYRSVISERAKRQD